MLFRMLYDDKLAQAAYLIGCQRTGEALLIDPERDIDRYLDAARREGVRIVAVAETHIHADFLSGARELAERVGAHLYLSGEGGDDWSYRWLDKKSDGGTYPHTLLHDGTTFRVGNIEVKAMHTPGHTPEHMSFVVTDIGGGASDPIGIATGDFVFVGDVGRPDLLESAAGAAGVAVPSAELLFDSLRRFDDLPEYLQVWPGHGAGSACGKALGAVPQSTVGYERRMNAALDAAHGERNAFVSMILDGQPEPPLYFGRMKRENREGPALLGALPQPRRIDADELPSALTNVVVVDTRPWSAFRDGHLEGSLHAPLTKSFPTIIGSYLRPEEDVILIVEESLVAEAVTDMVRIGLDRVVGYVSPDDLRRVDGQVVPMATSREIDAVDFIDMPAGEAGVVLDVRGAAEFGAGHRPGALNIPHTRLADRLDELPADGSPLFVYCQAGARSAAATAFLETRGYQPINVAGGYEKMAEVAAAAGAPA